MDSDATAILTFGPPEGGSALTLARCVYLAKPYVLIDAEAVSAENAATDILRFVAQHDTAVLNVAGPRESRWLGGRDYAASVSALVLTSAPGMDTGMDAG